VRSQIVYERMLTFSVGFAFSKSIMMFKSLSFSLNRLDNTFPISNDTNKLTCTKTCARSWDFFLSFDSPMESVDYTSLLTVENEKYSHEIICDEYVCGGEVKKWTGMNFPFQQYTQWRFRQTRNCVQSYLFFQRRKGKNCFSWLIGYVLILDCDG
jgi:hypothetical protein